MDEHRTDTKGVWWKMIYNGKVNIVQEKSFLGCKNAWKVQIGNKKWKAKLLLKMNSKYGNICKILSWTS
jgi:hypothetical protein